MSQKQLEKDGYVVVRWMANGNTYVKTGTVYAHPFTAKLQVIKKACEQVVPWQGSQESTLEYVRRNRIEPMEKVA